MSQCNLNQTSSASLYQTMVLMRELLGELHREISGVFDTTNRRLYDSCKLQQEALSGLQSMPLGTVPPAAIQKIMEGLQEGVEAGEQQRRWAKRLECRPLKPPLQRIRKRSCERIVPGIQVMQKCAWALLIATVGLLVGTLVMAEIPKLVWEGLRFLLIIVFPAYQTFRQLQ